MKIKNLFLIPFAVLLLSGCGASTISSNPLPGAITPDTFVMGTFVSINQNASLFALQPTLATTTYAQNRFDVFFTNNNGAAINPQPTPTLQIGAGAATPLTQIAVGHYNLAPVASQAAGTILTFNAVSTNGTVMTASTAFALTPTSVSVNGIAGSVTITGGALPAAIPTTAAAPNTISWTPSAGASPNNYFVYIYDTTTSTVVNIGGSIPYIAGTVTNYTIPANTLVAGNQYLVFVGSMQNGWVSGGKFPSILVGASVDLNVGALVQAQ